MAFNAQSITKTNFEDFTMYIQFLEYTYDEIILRRSIIIG